MLLWMRHGARLARDLAGHATRTGRAHVAVVVVILVLLFGILVAAGSTQPGVPFTVYTLL